MASEEHAKPRNPDDWEKVSHEERLKIPESVFLKPSNRTYPYKIWRDDEWQVSARMLRAAISRANSQEDTAISNKASNLLEEYNKENGRSRSQGDGDHIRMTESTTANKNIIRGCALVFNKRGTVYDIPPSGDYAGFKLTEVIHPRALDDADMSDVKLFANHEHDIPLARYTKGQPSTMMLTHDENGLSFSAKLDPSNPQAAAVLSAISRGDMRNMSFGFRNEEADMESQQIGPGEYHQQINRIRKITEISVVNDPAYMQTHVEARKVQERFIKRELEQKKTIVTDEQRQAAKELEKEKTRMIRELNKGVERK